MSAKIFTYEALIREQHLDSFGHVNNAQYFVLLEEARWDFITANGYGLEAVIRDRRGPVILEIHLRMKKELRLRERITIESQLVAGLGRKVMELSQNVRNAAGDIAAEAMLKIGILDLDRRRLVSPTPPWLRALGVETLDSPSKS